MPKTDPTKPLCSRCNQRNAVPQFKGLCSRCYTETKPNRTATVDLGGLVAEARTEDDWKKLYQQVEPIAMEIAKGNIEASAAQAAIIKEIFTRAHGKVSKSQSERASPTAVVVLPTIGEKKGTQVCALCIKEHANHYKPMEEVVEEVSTEPENDGRTMEA